MKLFTEECGSPDGLLCLKSRLFCPGDDECLCTTRTAEFGEEFGEEFEVHTCKAANTNFFTEHGTTMALVCSVLAPFFLVASILSCSWFCCAVDRDQQRVIVAVPDAKTSRLRSELA